MRIVKRRVEAITCCHYGETCGAICYAGSPQNLDKAFRLRSITYPITRYAVNRTWLSFRPHNANLMCSAPPIHTTQGLGRQGAIRRDLGIGWVNLVAWFVRDKIHELIYRYLERPKLQKIQLGKIKRRKKAMKISFLGIYIFLFVLRQLRISR